MCNANDQQLHEAKCKEQIFKLSRWLEIKIDNFHEDFKTQNQLNPEVTHLVLATNGLVK